MKEKIMNWMTKKRLITIGIIVVVVILGVGGYTLFKNFTRGEAQATLDMASLYQDEIVEISDIIVGVSETGTASLVYEEIDLDEGYEVTEILAVAGVYVEEGEVLAILDLEASEVNNSEELEELEDAEDTLAKLEIETASKKVEAKSTYDAAVAAGESAQTIYDLEIDEINAGLTDLEDQIEETEDEIADLESQQKNGLSYDYGLSSLNEELVEISASLSAAKSAGEDTTQLQSEYDSKKAEIVQATSQYDEAYADLDSQIDELEDMLDNLETEKTKYAASMSSLKVAAKSDYNSAITTYNNAYENYSLTIKELDAALEEAEELVEELTEELESDEEDEAIIIDADGNLLAPCSGYIMTVTEPTSMTMDGNTIETGLSITVSDNAYAQIDISVSQDDIADIYIGMPANVLFDAYEEVLIISEVSSLSLTPSGDMTSSVNYTVTILCEIPEDEDMTIFSSMTATVTFVEAQSNDVLAISTNYVNYEDGVQYVYRESADGTIELVEITTGFSDGFDVEIISGLEEGDIVVNESAVIDLEN